MKQKILTIVLLLVTTITLTSCYKNEKVDITTSLYPSYDIAKNIVGNNLSVNLLVKPGTEVHGFTPSSRQIELIKQSKLFIFTSYEMDLWLNDNVTSVLGKSTKSINLSLSFDENLLSNEHVEDEHHHDDLHFWTDPLIYLELIDTVLEEIILIDSENQLQYVQNAVNYKNKIMLLHNEINNYFNNMDNPIIYFSGHNAMQQFSNRYNLNIVSLSHDNKPDADLTSNQIKDLLQQIKTNHVNYLFIEEIQEPKVANTIKKELSKENYSLSLLELHGYHNLTKDDFNNKVSYYDLLLRNFNNIKKALGD